MLNRPVHHLALLVGLIVAVATAHPAQGETLLRWKFKAGQKSRLVIAQEMQMKMGMQNPAGVVTSTSTMEFDWEVTDVDEEGVATFTQTADWIRMKTQGAQGVIMEYDSQSDQKPEGMAAMIASAYEGFIGKAFVVEMDSRGNVVDLKLPQGLAESMGKLPGGAQLGSLFSEEGMKNMAELATFPEEPVKPGDTWTRTATMKNPALGDTTLESTFRYAGTETRDGRELEKITMEAKMEMGEGKQIKMKLLDQSNTGTIYFDNALGLFVSSESKSKSKMEMSILGQKMEQEIETTSKTERIPVNAAE